MNLSFHNRRGHKVKYLNYRGEASVRTIEPISLRFGTSEWHKDPQWLLRAIDYGKNEEREFALRDMVPAEDVPA